MLRVLREVVGGRVTASELDTPARPIYKKKEERIYKFKYLEGYNYDAELR